MPRRRVHNVRPRNPLTEGERAPNVRLRKTRPGSIERALYERDYGEFYPPKSAIRSADADGATVELPTLEDGSPDLATQSRGFYSDYAHRIVESAHGRIHYRLLQDKGRRLS